MLDANDQDHFARPMAFRMEPVVEWLHFIGRRTFFFGQDFFSDLLEVLVGLPADLATRRQLRVAMIVSAVQFQVESDDNAPRFRVSRISQCGHASYRTVCFSTIDFKSCWT